MENSKEYARKRFFGAMYYWVSNNNDINFEARLEVLVTFLFIFGEVRSIIKTAEMFPIYISNIDVARYLTLKVVNKSYFFNSSYKTYVNGLCFEASATS